MKKQTKQIVYITLAVLTSLGIWLGQNIQAQKKHFAGASPVQALSRFEQSETGAGTLTVVRNSNGKEIFGKTHSTNEGYAIAYQIQGHLPGGQKASPRVVFATANNYPKGLLECRDCSLQNREFQKRNPNAAVATAVTSDHALMITSSFKFDTETERLAVHRIIENVSNDPEVIDGRRVARTVKLLGILLQYHSGLSSGIAPKAGIPKLPSAPPRGKSFISNFLPGAGLAVTSTCGWCPTQCELTSSMKSSSVMTLCVYCPGKYDPKLVTYNIQPGSIGYMFMNGLVSSDKHCPDAITIGGFTSDTNVQVGVGERALICVKCDPEFWMTSIPNVGASTDSLGCQLAVQMTGVSTLQPNGRPNNHPAFNAPTGFMQTNNRMRAQTAQGDRRSAFAALPVTELRPGGRIEVVTVYSLK
jgi:hypothetical protein